VAITAGSIWACSFGGAAECRFASQSHR
jgi:hypothetical protein